MRAAPNDPGFNAELALALGAQGLFFLETGRDSQAEAALRLEPGLNPDAKVAVEVPDATVDPMRLVLRFFATAQRNGADLRTFTEVTGTSGASGVSRAADMAVTIRSPGSQHRGSEWPLGSPTFWSSAVSRTLCWILTSTLFIHGYAADSGLISIS